MSDSVTIPREQWKRGQRVQLRRRTGTITSDPHLAEPLVQWDDAPMDYELMVETELLEPLSDGFTAVEDGLPQQEFPYRECWVVAETSYDGVLDRDCRQLLFAGGIRTPWLDTNGVPIPPSVRVLAWRLRDPRPEMPERFRRAGGHCE